MEKKYKSSLRIKLLAILILLPTIGMLLYSVMAIRLFINDKEAYIFDSAVNVAQALATQAKLEIGYFEKISAPIYSEIDPTTFKLNAKASRLFNSQNSIEHLFIFEPMGNGIIEQSDYAYISKRTISKFDPGGEVLEKLLQITQEVGFAIQDIKGYKRYFLVAKKIESVGTKKHPIALAVYEAPNLYESFASPTSYKSYLLSRQYMISIEPKYIRKQSARTNTITLDFFAPLFSNQFPMGISEINTSKGDPMYVSFAKVGVGDLIVASVVDKKDAMSALDKFVIESLLFLLGLLGLITMIGIISSFGLTSALSKLVLVTQKIAKGDFNVQPDIKSNDEVHQLADSIESMSKEVQRLMVETAQQARMTNELETVKATQSMLFPPNEAKLDSLDIASVCEPASECGGDWFHYNKTAKGTVTIWIGDVTGHGAPAALVTSAAKAISAILELIPDVTPSQALSLMNHAIYSTTKGKTLMTFFLGEIDLATGIITYSCASHEFPFVIPNQDKLSKKDFVPLCDATGPRLGEAAEATYNEVKHQLKPGDSIFMYTDGAPELKSPEDEILGERRFLQIVSKSFKKNNNAKKTIETMRKEINLFRNGANLADDLTLYICKYSPAKDTTDHSPDI